MPNICCVTGCNNRSDKHKLQYYRLPSVYDTRKKFCLRREERLNLWLKAIRKENLNEVRMKHARVCSKHFIKGKPAHLLDDQDPDWVPSLHMGYECEPGSTNLRIGRPIDEEDEFGLPISPPLHVQLISHTQSTECIERAVSPVVLVSDTPSLQSLEFPPRADSAATATIRVRTDELRRSASSPQSSGRSSHCPVVRSGPALGCNYCWNTVDTHGRILRRKTKYHCPECQTNLCIVPCFQEYHERHVSSGQTDPIALTTSVMKVFPKTTTM